MVKLCSISHCKNKHRSRGFCDKHYQNLLIHKDPLFTENKVKLIKICIVENCGVKHYAKEYCRLHYNKFGRKKKTLQEKRLCLVSECKIQARGSGYCSKHYRRFLKHGDPNICIKIYSGQGIITRKGYREIYKPTHPNANKRGWIAEHRYVMSDVLSRPLLPNENVHHKNGNKLDNRPENLELWTRHQPIGQRVEDLLRWAYDIINKYEHEFINNMNT